MDWNKLKVFHIVAEAGSLTCGGKLLKLSQSAISRQISALEESLRIPLFHRHARGLILTEQGETLNQTVREVFNKLEMTRSVLEENQEKAIGHLKVTTTRAFGSYWLIPRLHQFIDAYPHIRLSLIFDDADLDLEMRQADVAIRMHPSLKPNLIQRHLTETQLPIYASKNYIEKHGEPASLPDLCHHRLLLFGGSSLPTPRINWLTEVHNRNKYSSIIEINDVNALSASVACGLGIASLPSFVANDYNGLVRLLPDASIPDISIFFVYPEELRSSKRIAVFRDFLLEELHLLPR